MLKSFTGAPCVLGSSLQGGQRGPLPLDQVDDFSNRSPSQQGAALLCTRRLSRISTFRAIPRCSCPR